MFSLRASLPLTVAALLFLSSDGWAQQELRSGKKGATNPAPVTSTSIDADHQALDVNVAGGTLGNVTISNADGAINDGVSNTIKATVLDLTNSNPLTVGIVDSSGNQISSFGGGTQYQQGDPSTTTDTMTMAGCVRVDTPAVAAGVIDGDRARCMVDSTGRLWVHVGVIDGTVAVTQSGTWNIATLTGITNPVAVTGTFWQATQPVSGTVTVTQGTGTNLHIVCDSGCSSSAGFADNSAFTFGTTAINPIGGVLDDTSTNTATENSAAVARITAQKALHTNLRNNSGTEIGTSGTPIRVDPTGSTTQPVSGTVTANIGTSGSLALDATLTGGTQKSIVRGGAKGTTSAADITSTASGSNHQPIDVVIYDTSGNAITSFGGSGGTSSNFGSAFPTPGTAAGFTDGTNMVAGRVVTSAPSSGDAGLVVRNINPNLAADNSTLSTAKVPVLPGTVSTSAPTWTNGNQSALSLQTDGSVRAAITNTPAVSQSGTWNIGTVTTLPALPANQSVNVAQINGVTPLMGAGNTPRSGRFWELYGNRFQLTTCNNQDKYYQIRGGSGYIWGDTVTGTNNGAGNLTFWQDAGKTPSDQDSVGLGKNQAQDPAYVWQTQASAVAEDDTDCSNCITANVDYFKDTGSFTGATGMGVGTIASRPSTCTTGSGGAPGVGYWATDEGGNWNTSNGTSNDGRLYKCTAANTWTLAYTPYTYPHPLIAGGGGGGGSGAVGGFDL